VLLFGLFAAYVVGAINRRLLTRAGVPEVIEGTAFERTAHEFDTSTVRILAKLSSYFILAVAVIVALTVADVNYLEQFWSGVAAFLPRLFVAIVVPSSSESSSATKRSCSLPSASAGSSCPNSACCRRSSSTASCTSPP